MPEEITRSNISRIRNPVFRGYAGMYLDIYEDFLGQVSSFGLPFDTASSLEAQIQGERAALKTMSEVTARSEDASFVYRRISSACEACRQGINTLTSHISFRCHRSCFFCFNPNQENYEGHLAQKNDWLAELKAYHSAGQGLTHIALTGGEPLLHPEEAAAFFRTARELYPESHLRLYTSGDLLNELLLAELRDAGLDEIRFSCKMEDTPEMRNKVLDRISLAKAYLPCVMVEMPVMPDREMQMRDLLLRLDEIGIWGINLLELCFPYHNAQAFRTRGFFLRYPPYRILYNFWYAGGLPVAGSELIALRLVRFAAEKGLSLGLHYCSLENKNFGQMYQQNHHPGLIHPTLFFSERDYYLKTVKAFGTDAALVKRIFDKHRNNRYLYQAQAGYIQIHPQDVSLLQGRNVELALSINVLEEREGERVTRELKLLRVTPCDCDPQML
ncbi:MAG: radical SAM protein [Blautia sp.]|nr:radical SAM protein [Blautia sp.]